MIYTIGHSNHPIERFVALLKQHGITAVADVRSMPFSRFNPQFNKRALKESLSAVGIEYVFLGESLGARTQDPECYENGRVSYAKLARTPLFLQGMERLLSGMASHRIAMMCAEKEPLDCHRTILVARELHERGVPIGHILATGETESQEAALARLRRRLGLDEQDLFGDARRANETAYETQGRRMGYAQPDKPA